MILLYHFLTKNERFYITLAFLLTAFVFWHFLPSHHEVKLVFLPLQEFEETHFQNLPNKTQKIINIFWITSGQDIQNAHAYQETFSSIQDQNMMLYIKNKIDKNLKRIIPSDYPNQVNEFFISKTSELSMPISICDIEPRDYHVQRVGDFGIPNWWTFILRKERKKEWNDGALECPNPLSLVSIGRIAWEYDTFPPSLLSHVNLMDQIWAPSSRTRDSLLAAGVQTPVITVPVYTNTSFWDPSLYVVPNVNDTTFRFVLNFIEKTDSRKIHFLIHAYLEEFSTHENVELNIITNDQDNVRKMIVSYIENRPLNVLQEEPEKEWPHVNYHNNDMDDDKVAQLYTTCDCFLYTSQFNSFPGEAMSMEIPSITNVPSEFMNEINSYIIPKLDLPRDICEDEKVMKLSQKFKILMRRAFSNPKSVKEKGKAGRQDLIDGLKNNPELIHKNLQELYQKNSNPSSKINKNNNNNNHEKLEI